VIDISALKVITTNTGSYPCKKMRLLNPLLSNRVQTDFDRSSASEGRKDDDGEASFEGFASVKIPHNEECKL
jgi:hypothetical protein